MEISKSYVPWFRKCYVVRKYGEFLYMIVFTARCF